MVESISCPSNYKNCPLKGAYVSGTSATGTSLTCKYQKRVGGSCSKRRSVTSTYTITPPSTGGGAVSTTPHCYCKSSDGLYDLKSMDKTSNTCTYTNDAVSKMSYVVADSTSGELECKSGRAI